MSNGHRQMLVYILPALQSIMPDQDKVGWHSTSVFTFDHLSGKPSYPEIFRRTSTYIRFRPKEAMARKQIPQVTRPHR